MSPRALTTLPCTATGLLLVMFVMTPWDPLKSAQAFVPVSPLSDSTARRSSQPAKPCDSNGIETARNPTERRGHRLFEAGTMGRTKGRHRMPSGLHNCHNLGGVDACGVMISFWRRGCNSSRFYLSDHRRRQGLGSNNGYPWIRMRSVPPLREAESPGDPSLAESADNSASHADQTLELHGEARMHAEQDQSAKRGEGKDEDDGEDLQYEQIVANMTKPLGITIEASMDKAALVYVTSVGEQAEDVGLRVGDVVTGVSGVFGDDIWSVTGKSVEKIRSMVRCRTEPYILVRVERGHVSLEERCAEGFGVETDEDGVAFCTVEDDDYGEQEFADIWGEYYQEELEVMDQGNAGRKAAQAPIKSKRVAEALDYPGDDFSQFSDGKWGGGRT